ncbi:MAG: hypothetical protein SVV03_05740 [Candidatus Nanohaloarchaea archaeon]|nr:hypothetical protein [Candidatus Nanohaloarchaea archaeon]
MANKKQILAMAVGALVMTAIGGSVGYNMAWSDAQERLRTSGWVQGQERVLDGRIESIDIGGSSGSLEVSLFRSLTPLESPDLRVRNVKVGSGTSVVRVEPRDIQFNRSFIGPNSTRAPPSPFKTMEANIPSLQQGQNVSILTQESAIGEKTVKAEEISIIVGRPRGRLR